MRIKLDENLPVSLTAALANLRHEVHTVAEENLSGGSRLRGMGSGAAR
jgi:hypothetical protein